MCSLLINNCIYFIVLLLFNVNLCSCMYYPIQNTKNRNKYLIDFKDLNQVCLLYFFMYFLPIVQKKKKSVFLQTFSIFWRQYRNLPYAIKWKKKIIKKKSLTLTSTVKEFPIAQQGLPFFRAESLQFTSFPD